MTDIELLELAAEVAGAEINGYRYGKDGREALYGIPVEVEDGIEYRAWNPLTDDGDALRLAVKLDIEIEPVPFGGRAIVRDDDDYGEQFDEESPDRMAATRRAIVRAAAEIAQRTTAREGER